METPEQSRQRFLDDHRHWVCQCCKQSEAIEAHHILGRQWAEAWDHRNLLAVCRTCHDMLGRSNPGKVLALRAKQDAGELDLEWFAFRPGYSVDGMLAGKWRDEWPELADDIRELLGES